MNQRFEEVIQGCLDQHGHHCWLYPPLVSAFKEIFDAGTRTAGTEEGIGAMDATAMDPITGRPVPGRTWKVRLYTIEVWNVATGALAGGEIGYTVGSIYTSLTGFTKEDSAGSVQLAALGRLLSEQGFHLWDLGMGMEYKEKIGSQPMPREAFVQEVHRVRATHGHLVLPINETPQNCKDIIDRNAPPSVVERPPPPPQKAQQPKQQQQQPKQLESFQREGDSTCSESNNISTDTVDSSSPESERKKAAAPNGKMHTHSPPVSGAQMPMKRVRKSDSKLLE